MIRARRHICGGCDLSVGGIEPTLKGIAVAGRDRQLAVSVADGDGLGLVGVGNRAAVRIKGDGHGGGCFDFPMGGQVMVDCFFHLGRRGNSFVAAAPGNIPAVKGIAVLFRRGQRAVNTVDRDELGLFAVGQCAAGRVEGHPDLLNHRIKADRGTVVAAVVLHGGRFVAESHLQRARGGIAGRDLAGDIQAVFSAALEGGVGCLGVFPVAAFFAPVGIADGEARGRLDAGGRHRRVIGRRANAGNHDALQLDRFGKLAEHIGNIVNVRRVILIFCRFAVDRRGHGSFRRKGIAVGGNDPERNAVFLSGLEGRVGRCGMRAAGNRVGPFELGDLDAGRDRVARGDRLRSDGGRGDAGDGDIADLGRL